MRKKQPTQFSRSMVMVVVFSEILMCAATITLACCGFDMTIGVSVIQANIPFAVVVFAAYSGNSAIEKWLTRNAPSGAADDNAGQNG